MTIEEVLSNEERQIFDRKSINIEPKALAVPLIAFANADGGTIAIGISDKTRRNSNGLVRIEPAERMPVYCLFAVYEDDCTIDSEGKLHITLSDEKKKTIREHFPKADGVVVIDNPDQFIEDVRDSIGHVMKHDEVHYYNIDEGYKTENSQVAMDMQYMMYVTQDAEPIRENGMVRYTFYEEYAYRVLFCKDLFFKNEQEYRFILPEEQIDEGTKYNVKLSSDYGISDIEDVLG